MDQSTHADNSSDTQVVQREDVLCSISSPDVFELVSKDPKPLEQIGFTGIVLSGDVTGDTTSIEQSGLRDHRETSLENGLELMRFAPAALDLWEQLEASPNHTNGVDLTSGDDRVEATTILQMSIEPIPIVPVNEALLYSVQFREQRELLRSAVFWRKRFEIAHHATNLIHAGEDGLLIYWIDSWLVSINQNPEEVSIDLGNHGSMWLMLGSHRDVHLHGSMLILPAFSAAVVANELAR